MAKFIAWDVGGRDRVRGAMVKLASEGSQGIIFTIDGTDFERMDYARVDIDKVLEPSFVVTPILFVVTKV